jgi:hypothetical protein
VSGQNLDAVLSASGTLDAVGTGGQPWCDSPLARRPEVRFSFSVSRVEDAAGLPAGTIDGMKDVRLT